MHGPALRAALTEDAEHWLQGLMVGAGPDLALVAVGSLGRRELTPASDLDLVLLHRGRRDIAEVADRLWYPIWDANVGLDHSVRTPAEAVSVARTDLKAALGLLDARHIAGDPSLTDELREVHLRHWRSEAGRRLPELAASCRERATRLGEVAFLLEPDLKSARGGLRDAQALWQAAAAQVADRPKPAIEAAKAVLLDVRGELQRRRRTDALALQEQDPIATSLGYLDADDLMAAVARSGRAIAYALDVLFRRVLPSPEPEAGRGGLRLLRGRSRARTGPTREPLADGVVRQDGEVVLALDADPDHDALLGLRVAAAAARAGLPIAPVALERLAGSPPLPDPWPDAAREAFVETLAAGPQMVAVLEAFDQSDLLVRMIPEWEHTRSRPQRNAYHRFTVDRHLLEAAANAAGLTRRVARPDLLLLGALFHDIGKGLPGDHTEVGVRLIAQIGHRLGLSDTDTTTLQTMVRNHLLLADTAQRRDLDDPRTIAMVAEAVGDVDTLELLGALTEADSLATGPAAWSPWKAGLLESLLSRVRKVLGGELPPAPSLTARQQQLLERRELALVADGDEIDVACPDRPGLLAAIAGILALHRLEIRTLAATSFDGFCLVAAVAHPRFGTGPDWAVVRGELAHALDNLPELTARVAERAKAYPPPEWAAPPDVRWVDDGVSTPVLEVRAPDGLGVLHRIGAAVFAAGGVVRSARCQTMGADVVDSFTVGPLSEEGREAVVAAVRAALDVAEAPAL